MKSAPNLDSAAYDMTAVVIWEIFSTEPLLGGTLEFTKRKLWPPTILRAFG